MAQIEKKDVLAAKLKAINLIVTELKKLPESERSDVVDFALKQVDMSPTSHGGATEKAAQTIENATEKPHLDNFVSDKAPRDLYQYTAVLAYHLKHYQKVNEFKTKDIKSAHVEARHPGLTNPADAISKAETRYRFFTKGKTRGTRQLSILGEKVVNALPDQDAVKKATAGNPSIKKQRKQAIRKSKRKQ